MSLAKARKDYYLQKLGEMSPREDYYLRGGHAAGGWRGSGAADIGLKGTVTAEGLVRLFDGEHPGTGEQLGRRLRRDGVAAWDLTFSVDKSVSLLWALGDPDVRLQVRRAFDEATIEALAFLESVASSTRGARKIPVLGVDGSPVRDEKGRPNYRVETWSIPTSGFVAASFTEFTSRADDPQLHTHVVVANRVRGVDGKWRTLDGKLLYRQFMAAGAIHEAELRVRLTQRLGVRWQPVENGLADIEGFTRDQLMTFSRRREEIDEWLDEHVMEATAANSERAALATRIVKQDRALAELRVEWHNRAHAIGVTPETIARTLNRSRTVTTPDPDGLAATLLSEKGLTANETTFGRAEVIRQIAVAMPEGGTRQQIEALTDEILTHDDVVLLVPYRSESRFTVAALLETEQRIIRRAEQGVGVGRWSASNSVVSDAISRHPQLTEGQREMIREFAASGNAIDVGVGPAGTGKSSALAVIRELTDQRRTPIFGTALSARAAAGFEAGTGIPSTTLARFTGEAIDQGLPEGVIVVCDEAGMVGSRQLARLSDLVEQAAGKLILIGDPHQLPEIEAGGLFQALARRAPTVELTENVRQTQPWEKEALTQLRDGSASNAVDVYREHERIITADCAPEAIELAVEGWHQDVESLRDITQVLLIAYQNNTVDQLNRRARNILDGAGHLHGPRIQERGRVFQAGDRVVCHKNRNNIGVLNGDLATITSIDPVKRRVKVLLDRNSETRVIPCRYIEDGYLDYGYAITGHKAQGTTARIGHTVAESTAEREWVYVAMSRGRDTNTLYLVPMEEHEVEDCTHVTHHNRGAYDAVQRILQTDRAQRTEVNGFERRL